MKKDRAVALYRAVDLCQELSVHCRAPAPMTRRPGRCEVRVKRCRSGRGDSEDNRSDNELGTSLEHCQSEAAANRGLPEPTGQRSR
jgi:hypothetical protein